MNIFHFAGKKLLSGILITSLSLLTIGSSFLGVGKVVGSFSSAKQQSQSQGEVQSTSITDQSTGSAVVTNTESKNNSGTSQSAGQKLATGATLQSLTSTPSGSCIITIFGKQYNVTNLVKTHSGGNVFTCGTDMTSSYQNRHGTNVSMMQGYLIAGGSVLAANSALSTSTPTPGQSTSSGACVITLFGKQYNITGLLTTHSGGNTFACGTDMSVSYQSRHGTNVSRMQGYLIGSGSTSTPTPTSGGGSAPTPTTGTLNPTSTPAPSGSCIVTLFGKQYNITGLLTAHSGGNIFACGTDMSASYQSKHGTNVNRMQGYLIGGSTPTPTSGGGATPVPTATPRPTSTPTPSGACIVTLFGKQYNVTTLRNTHSGPTGSYFVCGSDMSSAYQSKHGTNVNRMQGYLVTTSGGNSTPTPVPSGSPAITPTPISNRDDDDD